MHIGMFLCKDSENLISKTLADFVHVLKVKDNLCEFFYSG